MKLEDLTGQKFGMLTVEKYVGKQKWECLCECGNRTIVLAANLKKGHTKSCGCLKEKNLVGKKIGLLTVVSVAEKDERNIKLYNCKCDCGNECVKRSDILLRGDANSCGCIHEENRIKAVKEKVFVDGTMPALIALDKEPTKANKSGVVGVNWDKSRNKWQASIRFKGHKYNLGRFENFDDAVDARKKAEKEIFGNFLIWYENYKQKK